MFFLTKPDAHTVQTILDAQRKEPFSYPEVGASRGLAPDGYNCDHHRIRLGAGAEAFARAIACLKKWKMFDLGWVTLIGGDEPTEELTVGILVKHLGFWSLSASRVIYVVNEPGQRYGFAYGTLTGHVERGEERFMIEYDRADDSVWYDLSAFSRPKHILARVGYPLSRSLQERFAKDSLQTMLEAVSS